MEILKNISFSGMNVQKRIADISDSLSDNFKQTVNSAFTPWVQTKIQILRKPSNFSCLLELLVKLCMY
jgi:hypothetical protein